MPLSPPAPRELEHTRAISIRGYRRTDGLYDIEAELSDAKEFGFPNLNRGYVAPRERIHGMCMRMTINVDMTIEACEAAMDLYPYGRCPGAAPNFARLAGLRIGRGFLRAAAERVGGTQGCTHLRELLQQMATTAVQTVHPTEARLEFERAGRKLPEGDGFDARITEGFGGPSAVLNSCHAYADDGDVVRTRWPHLHKG